MTTRTDTHLSTLNLSEICTAAQRLRSAYLRSLVLGRLSCGARADSAQSSSGQFAERHIKRRYTLPAALIAGSVIGAIFTPASRAQSTSPAYVVAEVAVHDAEVFAREYAPKVAGTVESYGGRMLVGGGKLTALEGEVPQRFVIIAFDSVEKARGWYDSPAYQQLVPVRLKTSKSTLFIAEGIAR